MKNFIFILLLLFLSINTFSQGTYVWGLKAILPKTGQSTVYVTNDDGTKQAGNVATPRFIDNGNGTITDKSTGLTWVKEVPKIIPGTSVITYNQVQVAKGAWAVSTSYAIGDMVSTASWGIHICKVAHTSGTGTFAADTVSHSTYWIYTPWANSGSSLTSNKLMTFAQALINVAGLTYAGYSDWRMPNAIELLTLYNYGATATPYTYTTYFPNTLADVYWSSTTLPYNTANVLAIDFSAGTSGQVKASSTDYLRPVRGGK